MEEGDQISLQGHIDPIEFHEYIKVILWEADPLSSHNLGEFTITRPVTESVGQDIYLPDEISGPSRESYRINYDLLEEPSIEPKNRIELLELKCNNAQGSKDRLLLVVNERIFWGPHEMKTNDVVRFENLCVDFNDRVCVALKDRRGFEWTQRMWLTAREYPINRVLRHVFSIDEYYPGRAEYRLRYRMRWRGRG
jgi:hypothetical protein